MNIEISPKEYEKLLNWDDGNMYCQLLDIDGKNDWRLPTFAELEYISYGANDFKNSYYWSSKHGKSDTYWIKYMANGTISFGEYKIVHHYIRPVRSINI